MPPEEYEALVLSTMYPAWDWDDLEDTTATDDLRVSA